MRRLLLTALLLALPGGALAADQDPTLLEERRVQLEALRHEVAAQIQLQAFDLVDELIYGWTQQPVFAVQTPVVLADVSVPVGFGTGLQAMIENHFASVVLKNPRSNVVLSHCPECTAVVVRSTAKGTVVAHGVDQPDALTSAGSRSASGHALFLDFEAEGPALVLRARITSLTPALPIVYAKTLTTTTSSAALLRSGDHLKSAAEARQEYLDTLSGKGPLIVPIKVGVRTYAPNPDSSVRVVPFVWVQAGGELALTQARAWTGSFSLGATWAPESHTGFMAQARIARLVTGSVSSVTRPDLYAFIGGSVTSIFGLGAALFRTGFIDTNDLLQAALNGANFSATFGAFQIGFELRAKNRIGISVFLESLPSLGDAQSIGRYIDYGILRFQAFGAEVAFCF